jgi:hypothetical protein
MILTKTSRGLQHVTSVKLCQSTKYRTWVGRWVCVCTSTYETTRTVYSSTKPPGSVLLSYTSPITPWERPRTNLPMSLLKLFIVSSCSLLSVLFLHLSFFFFMFWSAGGSVVPSRTENCPTISVVKNRYRDCIMKMNSTHQ